MWSSPTMRWRGAWASTSTDPVPHQRVRSRRGAGAAERGGLENRCAFAGTEGSNPSLSAIYR